MSALALALATAAGFGAGDFFAGLAARRQRPLAIAVTVQAVGVLTLSLAVVAVGGAPGPAEVGWGAAGGLALGVGTLVYFRALAIGRMGIVATVTAVLAALVPVATGLAAGERPEPLAWLGIAVVLVSIGLIAGGGGRLEAGGDIALGHASVPPASGLADAALAGVCFGLFTVGVSTGASAGGAWWTALAASGASLTVLLVLALATRLRWRFGRTDAAATVAAGLLGAVASVTLVLATTRGLLALVAVIASLSPAPTMVLARVVLGERVRLAQLLGVTLALAGVVMISIGAMGL